MKLGFRIAVRFLKSSIGQTILIILGIAIGVSVQIFIGSLIQGLQKSLINKTIGNSPQITITSDTENKRITDYETTLKELTTVIEDNGLEIKAVSAADDNPALLGFEKNTQSVLVRGFDLETANQIYKIKDKIIEGSLPKASSEVLLGVNLKEEYGIELNDVVTIITSDQVVNECKVVGFYDLQVANINKTWVITGKETTDAIFKTENTITSIELQVNDNKTFEADGIATQLKERLGKDTLVVENWKEQNEQLLSGLKGQSISSIMIQVFVMISVVLGIASVLAITVLQKSKQIGILKAMGLKNRVTSFIFLFEGLILGLFGAIVGIILGLGLAVSFTTFAVNPDGTPVVALYISYSFIALSGFIAVIASVLASLIPAIRSSKLNPIDIIRNN